MGHDHFKRCSFSSQTLSVFIRWKMSSKLCECLWKYKIQVHFMFEVYEPCNTQWKFQKFNGQVCWRFVEDLNRIFSSIWPLLNWINLQRYVSDLETKTIQRRNSVLGFYVLTTLNLSRLWCQFLSFWLVFGSCSNPAVMSDHFLQPVLIVLTCSPSSLTCSSFSSLLSSVHIPVLSH